jgi:hypothetical protein
MYKSDIAPIINNKNPGNSKIREKATGIALMIKFPRFFWRAIGIVALKKFNLSRGQNNIG